MNSAASKRTGTSLLEKGLRLKACFGYSSASRAMALTVVDLAGFTVQKVEC